MSIISVNASSIFNAIGGGSPLSILSSVIRPTYAIRLSETGEVALYFNGLDSIQPTGSASIVNSPVEGGSYQSINKILAPRRCTCEVIIRGGTALSGVIPSLSEYGSSSPSQALEVVKKMLESTDLYDIETPREILEGFDLVGYNYYVTHQKNVSMLVISLDFQEVIQQMEVIISSSQTQNQPTNNSKSQSPDGSSPQVVEGSSRPANLNETETALSRLRDGAGISQATRSPEFISPREIAGEFVGSDSGSSKKISSNVKQISEVVT